MYKFAGYTIRKDGVMSNVLANNKETAEKICAQHNVEVKNVVQLFYFEPLPYVEPANEDLKEENDDTHA